MNQAQLEALYSHRGNHMVLHKAIRHEFDDFMFEWALQAAVRIDQWLMGSYYQSKQDRLAILSNHITWYGMDSILVPLMATLIHTRTNQTIQQAVGYLANHLPHEDPFAAATTAAEILALCQDNFYVIERHENRPATIRVNYWELIEKQFLSVFDWINDTTFNLPMLEPPEWVTNNRSCGYHSFDEPLLLGRYTDHDSKLDYDNINILNQIEWVLDAEVLKEPERPSKPIETAQQHQQFLDMAAASQQIYPMFKDKVFHFCWQYDSRGRSYSHGYHINFQSSEYKKALLNFNRYEELT